MAAQYDIERLIDDLVGLVKTNLNTKLTEITIEKGDSLTLKSVNDSAYIIQSMNQKIINFDPFIWVIVNNPESDGIGPHTALTVPVDIVILVKDQNQDQNLYKRMFRYGRALKEVIEDNWEKISFGIKLKVNSLAPAPVVLFNTSDPYKAVGVQVEADFA